jgi:hypothetical protein
MPFLAGSIGAWHIFIFCFMRSNSHTRPLLYDSRFLTFATPLNATSLRFEISANWAARRIPW